MSRDDDPGITCGDVGIEMLVLRIDDDLAVCEDGDGDVRSVEVALVDGVEPGDRLLVHADVALVRLPASHGGGVEGVDAEEPAPGLLQLELPDAPRVPPEDAAFNE